MDKKKLRYVAFYNVNEKENRIGALSQQTKVDYISSVAVKMGYEVEIISPSWTNNTSGFYKGAYKQIANNISLRTFATFGAKNKISRIIKYIFSLFQLLIYLLINAKKDTPVIVYHSILLYFPIKIAKFLKKFNLILEVEEIYQDAQQNLSKFLKKTEYNTFKIADKFLFSTELLNLKINLLNKPSSTIYGTYQVEADRGIEFKDERIHVVYAGTFDPQKGGADTAVAASEFLTGNYHLHIIGFGSEEHTKLILEKIKEVSKKTDAIITYDGLLKGEEYIQFLQKCDIGLSTQNPNASYNETSFPSKVLSYMSNGLRVVSVRIKVVEKSTVGKSIYYFDEYTPKMIAEAIMSIDMSQPYDSKSIIKTLNHEFLDNLKELLEK